MSESESEEGEKIYAYSLEVIRSEEGISFRPSFNLNFDDPRSVADVYYFIQRAEKLLKKVLRLQGALDMCEEEKEFFDGQFKKLRGNTPEELISEADSIEELFEDYLRTEPHG